jgi:NitT/TauT family transport system ATP-binding protein
VSKAFAGRQGMVTALREVSLTVPPGQFLSVIGPSGCGKSTLLRIIGGLEPPTSGTVQVGGPAAGPGRTRVAFVFQDYGLFPWLSAADNVAFGLRMAGVAKKERTKRSARWLDRMKLTGFADAYPHTMSGGMRQRLSLARAFVTEPDILLMDEPMGALDAQTRSVIQEDLVTLWEQTRKTVVLVTHSIEEALLLGDRVVVMTRRPGRITSDLTVALGRPRTMATTTSSGFGALKAAVWEALRDEAAAAMDSAT